MNRSERQRAEDRDTDLAAREDPYHVTQASRIYFLPNLMTAGNLFCGFMAIVQCIQARLAETSSNLRYLDATAPEHYHYAVYFIFGAAVCDALDGRLARMGGRESLFGAEFDSLADVISFGMAPALLMFYFVLAPAQGPEWFRKIGWFVGFVYLLCAAMRLARFNVITNPLLRARSGIVDSNKDFVGLPVPAAASTVAATVLFLLKLQEAEIAPKAWAFTLVPLMLLIALLMMSTIRYPSGKKIDLQTRTRARTFALFLAIIAAVIFYKEVGVLGVCFGYIFFGLFRHVRRPPAVVKADEDEDENE